MIFRFLLISDEVEGFKREIQIDADSTFYDFHKSIINSVNYEENEQVSFRICDYDWEEKEIVSLVERQTYSDVDCFVMEDTPLEEFLEDEKQRLMYVFDPMNERAFYIELREIILGKSLDKPTCSMSTKQAPVQFIPIEEEEVVVAPVVAVAVENDFYDEEDMEIDEEGYDMDELDADGFDGLDEDEHEETPEEGEVFE